MELILLFFSILFESMKNENLVNSPRNLVIETVVINHNFSQQVLKTGVGAFSIQERNPFIGKGEENRIASVGYRYRKWDLNGITLVARCEHDALKEGPNGKKEFLTNKALLESVSKPQNRIDMFQKLNMQRSNDNKLVEWIVEAILAGSDKLIIGSVARINNNNSSKHLISGAKAPNMPLHEYAKQIGLNIDNAWGILRHIISYLLRNEPIEKVLGSVIALTGIFLPINKHRLNIKPEFLKLGNSKKAYIGHD